MDSNNPQKRQTKIDSQMCERRSPLAGEGY